MPRVVLSAGGRAMKQNRAGWSRASDKRRISREKPAVADDGKRLGVPPQVSPRSRDHEEAREGYWLVTISRWSEGPVDD